jgi:NAD(P)-dependent dehydrogenase (short-subunit alcohol dehydrogenase family)
MMQPKDLNNGDMAGQVAIVTGGGSGIGRAACLALAQAGAIVAVGDVNPETARQTAAEIAGAGGQAHAATLDVTDAGSVKAFVAEVIARFQQIDVLVNNAGGAITFTPVHACAEADWDSVLALNLKGTFLMSREVLPGLMAQRQGAIVNVSSIAGMVGVPSLAAYSSAKGALIALTRQMACDYGSYGIRVNAVAPGPTLTPPLLNALTPEAHAARAKEQPLERLGEPWDTAEAIVFLASGRASWISGVVLPIDGAKTAI